MAGLFGPHILAPSGSTGNNTHPSVNVHPAPYNIAGVLVIEAVGATPTITAKLQGTLDAANDGSANWFDLATVEPQVGTEVVGGTGITKTTVGAFPMYFKDSNIKFVRRIRLVTSANTNVTYRGELYQHITEE